jgi:hypothetical protein
MRDNWKTAAWSAIMFTLLAGSRPLPADPEPPLTIAISTTQTTFQSSAEIKLQTLLTNTSSHDIVAGKGHGDDQGEEAGYRILVSDAEGNSPPETRLSRVITGTDPHPPQLYTKVGVPIHLSPGQTLKDGLVVNKFYDLRKPGKYTIQVKYMDRQTRMTVKSNKLTITVAPEVSAHPCRLTNGAICEDYLKDIPK